jgi:hypothetical protein
MPFLEGRMALGIGDLLVHSFLYGLLKSLILGFDFGWRSGSSNRTGSSLR